MGTEFAELGHEIVYGSREPGRADVQELVARTAGNAQAVTPPESIQGADIVVLAVPGALAIEIVSELGDLSGKILIQIWPPRLIYLVIARLLASICRAVTHPQS